MKLRDLLEGLPVKKVLPSSENPEITGLAIDSRKVRPGYLYVAIVGEKDDGHRYLPEALERGARAILTQTDFESAGRAVTVVTENTRGALPELAGRFYRYPAQKLRIVGVTGTNGKTTTTYLIESIIYAAGKKAGVIGTINYRVADRQVPALNTTPGPLELQEIFSQSVEAKCHYAVIEVSSHGLAQGRVSGIPFDVCLFTNITPHEHLDYHGTFRNYLEAKASLFSTYLAKSNKEKRVAVINRDDRAARYFYRSVPRGVRLISYGFRPGSMVRGFGLVLKEDGVSFRARTPMGEAEIMLKLPGRHNAYNALAALAFGVGEGIALQTIRQGLEELRVVPGRFEDVETSHGFRVVVDYAHTDIGLKNLLMTAHAARKASKEKPGRILLVFGCGGDRDKSKRPKMGRIASAYADYFIITSDNPRNEEPSAIISDVVAGILSSRRSRYEIIPDRAEAIHRIISFAKKGDIVLIAGKGHETYQIMKDTVIPFDDRLVAGKALL
ncbi:MAG: UDP-N-acetylmuramoyl-L-alanyl-D-glutamate--2,6-diaminopimelate ligase [Candidatus Omnitrophota bacterium]|nr:UDP-N-acetylmuramoyl-L-alanyl-D-glutamate--2,6-diaminopimelate ligase [Candidatus Omnitrophota bacterium]